MLPSLAAIGNSPHREVLAPRFRRMLNYLQEDDAGEPVVDERRIT